MRRIGPSPVRNAWADVPRLEECPMRSTPRYAIAAMLTAALAAPIAKAQPPRVSVDSSVHGRVDASFAQWNRTDSPGCAVGVYRGGGIEYARGYGMANLEL